MDTLSVASNRPFADDITTSTYEEQSLPTNWLDYGNRIFMLDSNKVAPMPFDWERFDHPLAIANPYSMGFSKSDLREDEDASAQQTRTDLSPLVIRQIEEVGIRHVTKLRERLAIFEADYPSQEYVSPQTMADVNELVDWLLIQSDRKVSATVSDGLLSVATIFPNEVRLYIEIERDGITEAAVTRERRYAIDVQGNMVADLTPEVILAAVASISSI